MQFVSPTAPVKCNLDDVGEEIRILVRLVLGEIRTDRRMGRSTFRLMNVVRRPYRQGLYFPLVSET